MIRYSQAPKQGTRLVKESNEVAQEIKKNNDPQNSIETKNTDVDDDGTDSN